MYAVVFLGKGIGSVSGCQIAIRATQQYYADPKWHYKESYTDQGAGIATDSRNVYVAQAIDIQRPSTPITSIPANIQSAVDAVLGSGTAYSVSPSPSAVPWVTFL
jgi:hypothetical protein